MINDRASILRTTRYASPLPVKRVRVRAMGVPASVFYNKNKEDRPHTRIQGEAHLKTVIAAFGKRLRECAYLPQEGSAQKVNGRVISKPLFAHGNGRFLSRLIIFLKF